ncbi:MAG: metallophosphoesterase, partial [Bacteroidota bacterium]
MNFTTFVKLIGALLLCPLLSACRTEFNHCDMEEQHCNDTIVRFAVIGDWGMWGSSDQRKVAESMAIVGTECPFDFIVSVGDNFYSNGVTSTEDPLWQSCFEEVYTSPALKCPWYVVLGNHDYRGQPQAELDYTSLSDRWVMPGKHFKVSENRNNGLGVDLFFMDSNPFQDDIAGTAAHPTLNASDTVIEHGWITNELANSINQWKFVFAHHPMYTCGMRKQLPQYMRELEIEFA